MVITVNVNIKAPELAEAIRSIATILSANPFLPSVSLQGEQGEQQQSKSEFSFKLQNTANEVASEQKAKPETPPASSEPRTEEKPETENVPETKPEPPKEEQKPETVSEEEAPKVTLEEVRAKLAALGQAGKQVAAKKLITDTGATKLTEVPVEKYGELLKAAEALA